MLVIIELMANRCIMSSDRLVWCHGFCNEQTCNSMIIFMLEWAITLLASYMYCSKNKLVRLVLWVQTQLLVMIWCGHASDFHMWVKCQPSHKTGEESLYQCNYCLYKGVRINRCYIRLLVYEIFWYPLSYAEQNEKDTDQE